MQPNTTQSAAVPYRVTLGDALRRASSSSYNTPSDKTANPAAPDVSTVTPQTDTPPVAQEMEAATSDAAQSADGTDTLTLGADSSDGGNGEVTYHVPFAESGRMHMRGATARNSFVQLYQFEKIHAAAHRTLARKHGLDVEDQRVLIATGVSEDGDLIAVAGATETRLGPGTKAAEQASSRSTSAPASAAHTPPQTEVLLRELAYVNSTGEMIRTRGAAIFGESQRQMPLLRTAGMMGAYKQALNNASTVHQQTDAPNLLRFFRDLQPNTLNGMVRALQPLAAKMKSLATRLSDLEESGTALTGVGVTGGPPQVDATILSPTTEIKDYSIQVDQLAAAHKVQTTFAGGFLTSFDALKNEDGDPIITAASKSFSFTLAGNTTTIAVDRSTTLDGLMHTINYGEDTNANGRLDTGISRYNDEDTNRNGTLDFDTAYHGVTASIISGRLVLSAAAGVTIDDSDSVLTDLGLTEETAPGVWDVTTTGSTFLDRSAAFQDLVQEDGTAIVELNTETFKLNGVDVIVTEEDNPYTLAQRINFGEDLNRNGTLDTNNDPYQQPVSAQEDANANGELDGGTAAHGVFAAVEDGQLVLTMTPASAQSMRIADPDDFLKGIRLAAVDAESGMLVFNDVLASPDGGAVQVDGVTKYTVTNETEDAIDGLRLTLKETGTSPVTLSVGADFETLKAELDDLASEFNTVMESLNDALSPYLSGLLKNEDHVNTTYLNLTRATQSDFDSDFGAIGNPKDFGLSADTSGRTSFDFQSLQRAAMQLRQGLTASPLQKAESPNSIFNSLDELGITSQQANTLSTNPQTLQAQVSSGLEDLRSALRDNDIGLLVRMAEAVQDASRAQRGLLAFEEVNLRTRLGSRLQSSLLEPLENINSLRVVRQLTAAIDITA